MNFEVRIIAKLYERVSKEDATQYAVEWYNKVCNGGAIGPTEDATVEIRAVEPDPEWEKIR